MVRKDWLYLAVIIELHSPICDHVKRELRPVNIEPDGMFSLNFKNLPDERCQKFFALEIDQDTESNIRYKKFEIINPS